MKINYKKYPLPKRLRHHTKPNLYIKLTELKETSDYYPPVYDNMDWSKIFFNSKPPDILDIGCGKGLFLLNLPELYPDKNLLGMEIRKPVVDWINNVIEGENIRNCHALWYSVVNGLNFIVDNSIEKIFYLFPDPWPKRKHLKRRAFNDELLNDVFRILKPEGKLYLSTDLSEINDYHKKLLSRIDNFNIEFVTSDDQWKFPQTNKELFCRKNKIEFFRLICTKMSL